MTKPESYPFLRIAKQFDVDYSTVLLFADWLMKNDDKPPPMAWRELMDTYNYPIELRKEIVIAVIGFLSIRYGEIDWMTGEPTNIGE